MNTGRALAIATALGAACVVESPEPAAPETESTGDASTGPLGCDIVSDPRTDPDSEAQAAMQPEVRVYENGSGVIAAVLPLQSTAWWGQTAVHPSTGCGVQLWAQLELPGPGIEARVCGFVECTAAGDMLIRIDCGTGDVVQSPLGRLGCCADALLTMRYACDYGDNTLFVRVDPTQEPLCTPFQVNFRMQDDPTAC